MGVDGLVSFATRHESVVEAVGEVPLLVPLRVPAVALVEWDGERI
jgi:hypothetical protein